MCGTHYELSSFALLSTNKYACVNWTAGDFRISAFYVLRNDYRQSYLGGHDTRVLPECEGFSVNEAAAEIIRFESVLYIQSVRHPLPLVPIHTRRRILCNIALTKRDLLSV